MLQLTPKTLKAQVIVWDAERETFEKIQELVKVECVIENQMPPAKLKVFLPTGQTALLNYGDVIGRDEADELVIISADEVEKHYDISTVDLLEEISEALGDNNEQPKGIPHIVTEDDLTANPELAEAGVKAGDEVIVPAEAIVPVENPPVFDAEPIPAAQLADEPIKEPIVDAPEVLDQKLAEAGGVVLAPNQEELEPEITEKPAKKTKKK